MPPTINPLRYPGAKRQLVPYVASLLECNNLNGCTFFEPYAGSAVVGLELLKKNIINKLVLIEKDTLIYSFWKCVFEFPEELCNRIEDISVDLDTWISLSPLRQVLSPKDKDVLDLGIAGLFFNRTNFSGIINANPIGGIKQTSTYKIDCRFNKSVLIDLIMKLSILKQKVEIHWDDALEYLNRAKRYFTRDICFIYFDPPYYGKGKQMYRHYYTIRDHKALATFVRTNKNFDWLISYDDDPYICGLYSETGAKYRPFYLDYSVSKRSLGKELLISNLPLPPVNILKANTT